MYYYRRNIGDYAKKAGRLSMLEHGAYNLLIDACYDREMFPTLEDALDWTWARTDAEVDAVKFVLERFFVLNNAGRYEQKRIAEEVEQYAAFREKQAVKGKKGGRPRGSENKNPAGSEKNPAGLNKNPAGLNPDSKKSLETTNHKPITNNKTLLVAERNEAYRKPAGAMFARIQEAVPHAKQPNLDKWANEIRLMVEQDKLEPRQIWEVFDWANRDDFWKTNILSPGKLRKQFARLDVLRKQTGKNTRTAPPGSTRARTLEQDLNDTSWAD